MPHLIAEYLGDAMSHFYICIWLLTVVSKIRGRPVARVNRKSY